MRSRIIKLLLALVSVTRYPEFMRLLWYRVVTPGLVRRRGVQLGRNVVFWGQPIITPAPHSIIDIGDRAVLCSRSEYTALGVNHPVVLRTLRADAELRIGGGARVSGCTICAACRVTIGDRVCLGANVTITDTDFHALDPGERASSRDAARAATGRVEIGADVFLGMNSLVLKNVRIGDGAVVGAGAVVTKDVPAGAIVAGNPARVIGTVPRGAASQMGVG